MYFEFSHSVQLRPRKLSHCHVIVCGNEKGGSGKSTTAMHVAVGLLKLGFRVATVDLDTRQQSLTRYNQYRRRWIKNTGVELATPA
ncbi:MAG: division plane positioning ATPase MipZ, partial [Pseudomonadota bacterium]